MTSNCHLWKGPTVVISKNLLPQVSLQVLIWVGFLRANVTIEKNPFYQRRQTANEEEAQK